MSQLQFISQFSPSHKPLSISLILATAILSLKPQDKPKASAV